MFYTQNVENKMQEIIKTLPKNIKISQILKWMKWKSRSYKSSYKRFSESILIVIVILIIFLWFKNALNTATSIPLILALVFIY